MMSRILRAAHAGETAVSAIPIANNAQASARLPNLGIELLQSKSSFGFLPSGQAHGPSSRASLCLITRPRQAMKQLSHAGLSFRILLEKALFASRMLGFSYSACG